jgi:hypothetical protein
MIVGLLLDGLTCLEQRANHSHQLGTVRDQPVPSLGS